MPLFLPIKLTNYAQNYAHKFNEIATDEICMCVV